MGCVGVLWCLVCGCHEGVWGVMCVMMGGACLKHALGVCFVAPPHSHFTPPKRAKPATMCLSLVVLCGATMGCVVCGCFGVKGVWV